MQDCSWQRNGSRHRAKLRAEVENVGAIKLAWKKRAADLGEMVGRRWAAECSWDKVPGADATKRPGETWACGQAESG